MYICVYVYVSRVCAFNKIDISGCEFALEWMTVTLLHITCSTPR